VNRRDRNPETLFQAAQEGDRSALARLLSLIEQGGDAARAIGRLSYPKGGTAYTVGLTGAPGAGKSTLTSSIIGHLRRQDIEVAVLAIDPSSPFTGGAILGDRVHMQDHATDQGVFIRSMATRRSGSTASWSRRSASDRVSSTSRGWRIPARSSSSRNQVTRSRRSRPA